MWCTSGSPRKAAVGAGADTLRWLVAQARTSTLDDLSLAKLALARQLLTRAASAANERGPLGPAIGVSLSQDALELLMTTLVEHHQVPVSRRTTFDQLIEEAKRLTPSAMSQRLQQVNNARIGFKHHGILPDAELAKKLIAFSSTCADDICREGFGTSLWSVSSTRLVPNSRIRNHLNDSQRHLDASNFEDSICAASVAYALTFGGLVSSRGRPEPRLRLSSSSDLSYRRGVEGAISELTSTVARDLEDVYGEIERLSDQVHSLKVGIDLDQLDRFEALAPTVRLTRAKGYSIVWMKKPSSFTLDDAEFCFDFAFDAILRFRPRAIPTSESHRVTVLRQTEIVIPQPHGPPEVIGLAECGQSFARPARPVDVTGYLQIVFEAASAYVAQSDATMESIPTPNANQ
jgi:hypothetical protein